ncbi:YbjQ family protein [Undibacterium danionis]|uniref:YbjQ family protein n=1 Tax=Undibacterium danionis TaxID=1812100 RepID=A0ABV6IDF9_9BURK
MSKLCLKCNYTRQPSDTSPEYECPKCGAIYAKVEEYLASQKEIQKNEQASLAQARLTKNWSNVDPTLIKKELKKVIFSTIESVPGYEIEEIVDVVCGDFTHAFGAMSEAIDGLARNLVGSGRSHHTEILITKARAEILKILQHEAMAADAHAIIGLRFTYEEISGANGHGVFIVTGMGTAVKLKKKPSQ